MKKTSVGAMVHGVLLVRCRGNKGVVYNTGVSAVPHRLGVAVFLFDFN